MWSGKILPREVIFELHNGNKTARQTLGQSALDRGNCKYRGLACIQNEEIEGIKQS